MTHRTRLSPWRAYLVAEAQALTCPRNGDTSCRYCRRDLRAARTRLALSAAAAIVVVFLVVGGLYAALTLAIAAFSPTPASVTNVQLPTE